MKKCFIIVFWKALEISYKNGAIKCFGSPSKPYNFYMKLFSIPGHPNELLEVIDSDDSSCITIYNQIFELKVLIVLISKYFGSLKIA